MESVRSIERKNVNLLECVNEACREPIFSDTDRDLISLDIENSLVVLVDKRLLSQVITNLIRNSLRAIKHIPQGQIKISAQKLQNRLSVIIHDNGTGINSTQQKNLFKPFYNLSTNGVGIGLAFSKLALESMGCSIACESKEGSFTRFTLTFMSLVNEKDAENEIATCIPIPHHNSFT